MCAVGFIGNAIYQAQQAPSGLQTDYNNSISVRNLDELQKEKILNEIQIEVENSFRSFEERYNIRNKDGNVRKTELIETPMKNTYYDQKYDKKTKDQPHLVRRTKKSIDNIAEESIGTTAETPTIVNRKFKKIDLYYDVKNLNDLQAFLIDLFEEMHKLIENFIHKLKAINAHMTELYTKDMFLQELQKEFAKVISDPDMNITELTDFISKSAIIVTQSLNDIKKYNEKIKKNKGFENLKLNVINELKKFYDSMESLINDAAEMYKSKKPKLQKEIEAYIKTNENYENEVHNDDKKTSEYDKFKTKIDEISLKLQNLDKGLSDLQFCITKNDFDESFYESFGLMCQKTDEINEHDLTTKDSTEKKSCSNEAQETHIHLYLENHQNYCKNETQEVADTVVETTKEKQCNGIKCGKTKFYGTSTNETQKIANIVDERTKEKQCDGIGCGKTESNRTRTNKKTFNGLLIASMLYSVVNRLLLRFV
ncbi:hypothetical protein BDAP_002452 [Binucleata daphniae]